MFISKVADGELFKLVSANNFFPSELREYEAEEIVTLSLIA